MNPLVSVITPSYRGAKELTSILRDFKNQTLQDFEHIIVYDGEPPQEVLNLMENQPERVRFTHIEKDMGNMSIAPGTKPRNKGIELAQGRFCVFCDDDDRYKDTYLEKLITGLDDNSIGVVQMSCQESRMYKNGDPDQITLIPEAGLPYFPIICHVGTPCFMVPTPWAKEDPWQEEPEHDFRFILRICKKYKPRIRMEYSMQVDVDGLVIKNMRDWVSIPPFYRKN